MPDFAKLVKIEEKEKLTSWGDITVGKTLLEAFLALLAIFLNILCKNFINKSTLLSASSSSLSSSIPSYPPKTPSSISYGSPPLELFSYKNHNKLKKKFNNNFWVTLFLKTNFLVTLLLKQQDEGEKYIPCYCNWWFWDLNDGWSRVWKEKVGD